MLALDLSSVIVNSPEEELSEDELSPVNDDEVELLIELPVILSYTEIELDIVT